MFSKPLTGPAQAEKGPVDQDNASCRAASVTATFEDLLGGENTDIALLGKMRLVNDAIDNIGWTRFHLKLFCLSGFGYAVDTLVAMLQSIVAAQAYAELGAANRGYRTGLTLSLYAGFLVGALFWGFTADVIGRRIAFNTTLFGSSISAIVAGAAPNWPVLGLFIALLGFAAGGNLVLDPTVFLEFLPGSKQWLVTAMATWWGFGQAAAGFLAWGYFSRSEWSCDTSDPSSCTWQNNKGWRLIMFTGGSVILVMSITRLLMFRLHETPKYMLSAGRDSELVEQLQALATKYDRPFSLTVEQLEACGTIENKSSGKRSYHNIVHQLVGHLKGLLVTQKLALSTGLVWLSWTLIGLAYPLFFIFLPSLISSRVPDASGTFSETWRDYTITSRRYTMAIGAVITAALFFGNTGINTPAQNLGLSCSISVGINIYYGTLYAYTAEVLPSAHRATGNGVGIALNRVMGLLSAVVAVASDTTTVTPLYICAALFIVLTIVSAALPFEPLGHRAS
ncbi:hypothetical protein FOYG_09035 [Fusarium oxysporum NRRL 32931]|uniref:Major facilitator superfamily (MFS) profile domain-containing protein n=1 Tax=Fusarium oxysporum NRRL 32931 TaxID=660029 RepID=W9IFQ3_FUSOX|nr:hypothetical protein FOYG_09035 [Fusarium oxysporum NRRL 32931]